MCFTPCIVAVQFLPFAMGCLGFIALVYVPITTFMPLGKDIRYLYTRVGGLADRAVFRVS